ASRGRVGEIRTPFQFHDQPDVGCEAATAVVCDRADVAVLEAALDAADVLFRDMPHGQVRDPGLDPAHFREQRWIVAHVPVAFPLHGHLADPPPEPDGPRDARGDVPGEAAALIVPKYLFEM